MSMDEMSVEQMRRSAAAANLRLAFGGPVGGDAPIDFASLLERLRETVPPAPLRGGLARTVR